MNKILYFSVLALLLVGCGADSQEETKVDIEDNTFRQSTRVSTASIEVGDNGCESGGVLISSGFDLNENGQLDNDEVTVTQVVCHGSDGTNGSEGTNGSDGINGLTSLIRLYDELAGDNCANGGVRVVSGVDLNSDSVLSSSEIQDTQYMCAPGAVSGGDQSCTVLDNNDGSATLSCEDGTSVIISNGANGVDGVDGNSCTVVDNNDGTATVSCDDGSSVVINSAASSSLAYNVYCYSQLDGDFSDIWWTYSANILGNGDIYVFSDISDDLLAVGHSTIYSPSDANYASADSYIYFDTFGTATAGLWILSYDQDSGGVAVQYEDGELVDGVISWAPDAETCTVYDYTNEN